MDYFAYDSILSNLVEDEPFFCTFLLGFIYAIYYKAQFFE